MTSWRESKYRSDDTWEQVRRAWESGETAQSCARRFQVGMDTLWKRRAKENWRRDRGEDPAPEPVEGWDRFAARKMDAFELRLESERALATALAQAMTGGPMDSVPLWHAGFVLGWRAEHLSPEAAARDRAWASAKPEWVQTLWDADGRLKPQETLDALTLRANREAWREDAGLPDGVAEGWP